MLELRLVPKRFLTIPLEEATFARRGFRTGDSRVRKRLEQVGESFLGGYHAALDSPEPAALAAKLDSFPSAFRGFAFEGAGMSLVLQDSISLFGRARHFDLFLAGPGFAHPYMLHVGAGWAFARLPWLRRQMRHAVYRFDPLLRWLAVDGFGFQEGYFHHRETVDSRRVPRGLGGYASRAFDQGLGRSLWFVNGADPDRIGATISTFDERRRADLWSGVGLACAYAGGTGEGAVRSLADVSGACLPDFAQGVAFAAKARQRAGNPSTDTELVCRLVCRMSSNDAASVTDQALAGLPPDGAEPAYEHWRRRIQTAMRRHFQISLQEATR